ncbi:hypothetical protein DFH06DRAFT_1142487 [Mycena polygramma]|nr:hypothetical protein DFH06DRAFT_1142487 [Mycena polygramma]
MLALGIGKEVFHKADRDPFGDLAPRGEAIEDRGPVFKTVIALVGSTSAESRRRHQLKHDRGEAVPQELCTHLQQLRLTSRLARDGHCGVFQNNAFAQVSGVESVGKDEDAVFSHAHVQRRVARLSAAILAARWKRQGGSCDGNESIAVQPTSSSVCRKEMPAYRYILYLGGTALPVRWMFSHALGSAASTYFSCIYPILAVKFPARSLNLVTLVCGLRKLFKSLLALTSSDLLKQSPTKGAPAFKPATKGRGQQTEDIDLVPKAVDMWSCLPSVPTLVKWNFAANCTSAYFSSAESQM